MHELARPYEGGDALPGHEDVVSHGPTLTGVRGVGLGSDLGMHVAVAHLLAEVVLANIDVDLLQHLGENIVETIGDMPVVNRKEKREKRKEKIKINIE